MLICIMVALLLWSDALATTFSFTYTDEIITLILGLYFTVRMLERKHKLNKYEKRAFFCMILFYCVGVLSTVTYNFQNSIFYGLTSGLFSIKAFVCFFGVRALLKKESLSKKTFIRILNVVEFPLLPVAILLIIDQFLDWFPHAGTRYGIKCSLFIFSHSTEVAGFAICSLLLSCFVREILSYKPQYFRNFVPAIIIVLLSGRYKALGFVALFTFCSIMMPFIKKFKLRYIFIIIPMCIPIVWNQVTFYINNFTKLARGMLYLCSLYIARDFFPLGSGFGTYGTEYSRRQYSPLYYMYNMEQIYGLSPNNPAFVCDTMWPGIIGETGVVGLLAILGMIFFFFKIAQKTGASNKRMRFYIYAPLIYLCIESVGETIFMNSKGCLIMVIFAFIITVAERYFGVLRE